MLVYPKDPKNCDPILVTLLKCDPIIITPVAGKCDPIQQHIPISLL